MIRSDHRIIYKADKERTFIYRGIIGFKESGKGQGQPKGVKRLEDERTLGRLCL
jgi:hypothetical protein